MSDRKAFPLRIDPEVFEALRTWADDELRSVNAQIEFLLVHALRDAGRAPKKLRGGGGGKGGTGSEASPRADK